MVTQQHYQAFIGVTFFLFFLFFLGKPVYAIESSPSHLKYFGYLDGEWYDPVSTYFSEMDSLGNTNIAWGGCHPTCYLAQFAAHHLKILWPTDAFFGRDSNGKKYLLSDWQTRWQAEQKQINPYINDIYAIYFDEPVHGGASRVDFLTATYAIRQTYPNMRILVIEAGPPFLGNIPYAQFAQIPADYYRDVTDIGFDYYFVSQSTNNDQGWNQYMNIFNHFLDYASGKNVWLVPDGYGDAATVARFPDAWERYIQFARDHNIVIGLLGFLYDPSSLESQYITLRNLMLPGDPNERPSFRWRQREVGMGIIANAPPIPTPTPKPTATATPRPTSTTTPTPKPGDLNGDRKVDIFDYNLLVGNFGKTGAAGFSSADIDKNGKVDIFDYNVLVGNFGK